MDPQTFEQEEVSADLFGSAAAFLLPDITVTLNFAPNGKAVSGMWQDLIFNPKETCLNDFFHIQSSTGCLGPYC